MSPQANKTSSIKTKRNPKTGAATRNDFFFKNLTLYVALKIPIFTRHCILLICIISNGNPYE